MATRFSEQESALWQRLIVHPFENGDALDFTARLMREQGWTRDFARRAIDEYRRFCFLSAVSPHALTPSEAVDEVWHLHLIYTQDYWETFCPHILGRPFHHAPTRGGRREQARFHMQYADTLAAYEHYFGPAPTDIWPDARKRFAMAARWRRVDTRTVFVVRKPALPGIAASLAALIGMSWLVAANAQSMNPLDWTAGPFLTFYLCACAFALAAGLLLRRRLRDQGAADTHDLSVAEYAYLAGGAERCTDATVAQMLGDGKLKFDATSGLLVIDKLKDASELEQSLAQCIAVDGKPDTLLRRMKPRLAHIEKRLMQRRLWLDAAADWRARALSAMPLGIALILGIAKMMIGVARDKPIGFLVLISVVMAIVALVLLFKRPQRTLEGDIAFAKAKHDHARVTRAPRANELGLAVAIAGTMVLSTTAFAEYHTVRHPPGTGGDSSGSSDSGDSGGGGGGCGGCGGGD